MTAGQMLAHYRIQERLGAGGMGVVYKALDTHLNRTVAIKVLPADAVSEPRRRQRFVLEARAASAIDHPNIVTIHDIAEAGGQHFIVMQYVAGSTLRKLLERGALDLHDALRYAIQIADALAQAHARGIFHRDLKPENVMVNEQGQVKVLDFGLAKLTDPPEHDDATTVTDAPPVSEEGSVVGTAAYMSPEQAQGKRVDARTDIFSFGTLLFEMITGRQPFRGDNRLAVLSAIVRDEPEKITAFAPSVPTQLEILIARALRKDPDRRWQSMADVRVGLTEIKEESESGGAVGTASIAATRRTPWISVAGLGVGFALVAVGVWMRSRPTTAPVAPAPRIVPFTSFPGLESRPAFSPDDNQIAFAWNGEKGDNTDIYVTLIGAGTPLRLTTDPAFDTSPAWSPDGRHIAFTRLSATGAEFRVVPALHGPERTLGSLTGDFELLPPRPAWSPDGKLLAVPDRDSPAEPVSVFLRSLETGGKRSLTKSPAGYFGDWGAAFSPDGQTLAFLRYRSLQAGDIYLLPLSSGPGAKPEPRRLTFDDRWIQGLDWMPDGRSLVFSSNRVGAQSLWKIAVAGGAPEPLPVATGEATWPAVARRGSRLAYTQQVQDTNIWRIRTDKGSAPARFIASTREDHYAEYSPDGKRIVFESSRSGNEEIWMCDSDGLNEVPLTSMGSTAKTAHPRWSPDGRRIVFDSAPRGQRDIYVLNVEGGGAPRQVTTEPSHDVRPSWSKNGRWIYFGSNRTGRSEIWKAPAEGGAAVQVTRNGGHEAFESPDGKHLYYVTQQRPSGVWKLPVEGGEEKLVFDGVLWGHWALANNGVYFVGKSATSASIEFFSFAKQRRETFLSLPKGVQIQTGMAVSPEGRWLLYSQLDRVESDIMLVENFR